MEDFSNPVTLGRTGLRVGRLGISSSYGAPAAAFEEAFEKGCNYFVLGSFMKGRSREMVKAIRNICDRGLRESLVICLMEYTHSSLIGTPHFYRGLKQLGIDYVDVLMLGFYPSRPRQQVMNFARKLRDRGSVRHIGLSGHNRRLFPKLMEDKDIDIFQVRYNAVNTGAEKEVFPFCGGEDRPGMIAYTATRWGQLLKPEKMPPGEEPLSAVDCYRFVLSNPAVDICMTGARTHAMLRENLETLRSGPPGEEEMLRIRRIGDFIYGKPRT